MQQNTTEEPSVKSAQGAYLLGLFLSCCIELTFNQHTLRQSHNTAYELQKVHGEVKEKSRRAWRRSA